MINRILVPLDGSEYSERALNYAVEFSIKFNAEVIITYVYSLPAEAIGLSSGNQNIENNLMMYGDDILKKAYNKLKFGGVDARTMLLKGETAKAITDTAEDEKCNLIIMGSRGLNNLKSIIMGSVSKYVVSHSVCPVMLVK